MSSISNRNPVVDGTAHDDMDAAADDADDADDVVVSVVENDGVMDDTLPLSTPAVESNRKTGRDPSLIWSTFTLESQPQQKKSAICQHCKSTVTHQKKIERAKNHLIRCPAYKKAMKQIEVSERPAWYVTKTASAVHGDMLGPSLTQTSITKFTPPKITKGELQQIEDNLAMHFYVTGTPFSRVGERHLLAAFKAARSDITLPGEEKLGGACLERCYRKIEQLANSELQNTSFVPWSLAGPWHIKKPTSCLCDEGTAIVTFPNLRLMTVDQRICPEHKMCLL